MTTPTSTPRRGHEGSGPPPEGASPQQGGLDRTVPLIVAATTFMLLLDSSILNTALPSTAVALGVRPLQLSVVVSVYLMAGAAVLPLSAWLGERFGVRRCYALAVSLFTLASLLCGLAQTAEQLVAARALQGAAGGLVFPIGRTLAMGRARKQDVLQITALLTWPALFAPVLGPPLGGWITTAASWRWNFLINVPIGLLSVAFILRAVPVDGPALRRRLDRLGAIGAALGLVLLLGGLETATHAVARHGDAIVGALGIVAAGIAVLAWTVRHLRRTPQPLVSLAPLAHPSFVMASASGGTLAMTSLHATPFLLPLLFQLGLGHGAVASGALLLPYFLGNLGMKSVTTPLMRRFSFRPVMLVSGACSVLALGAFGWLSPATPSVLLIALLVFAGAARSMLLTALNTLTFADVSPAQRAAASTLSTVSVQVAAAVGVALVALTLASSLRMRGAAVLTMADFGVASGLLAGLMAVAVLLFRGLPHDVGAEVTRR